MSQDKHGNSVTVDNHPADSLYAITYPENQVRAGFAQYLDHAGERIFYHTEVDEAYGGRGLASILIGQALTDTTAEGPRIVAVCPFVKNYLEKKGHEGDHRLPRPEDLDWLRQQIRRKS